MANTEDYLDSLLNSINNTNMSGKKSKSYSGSDPYDNASEAFRKFEREQEYKRDCMVLGREVLIITAQAERPAKAVDLDGQCGLIVEYPDGTRQTLKAGEVRIREKKG